jgi:hypothetical protein
MICVVLRYGQPTQPQPLARAVQTGGVAMVRLMVGEVACDVPMGRTRGAKGRGHTTLAADHTTLAAGSTRRGRAVVSCVAGAVTNPIPYYGTRVFARRFRTHALARTPHICEPLRTYAARTPYHAPTGSSPAHPPSCTLHAFYCQAHRFSLLMLAFLLRTYAKRRIFAPV